MGYNQGRKKPRSDCLGQVNFGLGKPYTKSFACLVCSLYFLPFGPNKGQTSKGNKSEGSMEADILDFLKSPSSCLFSTRWTKDFSYLIAANFSDPKMGNCASTNQRSLGYPSGTELSNYVQQNMTCG